MPGTPETAPEAQNSPNVTDKSAPAYKPVGNKLAKIHQAEENDSRADKAFCDKVERTATFMGVFKSKFEKATANFVSEGRNGANKAGLEEVRKNLEEQVSKVLGAIDLCNMGEVQKFQEDLDSYMKAFGHYIQWAAIIENNRSDYEARSAAKRGNHGGAIPIAKTFIQNAPFGSGRILFPFNDADTHLDTSRTLNADTTNISVGYGAAPYFKDNEEVRACLFVKTAEKFCWNSHVVAFGRLMYQALESVPNINNLTASDYLELVHAFALELNAWKKNGADDESPKIPDIIYGIQHKAYLMANKLKVDVKFKQ